MKDNIKIIMFCLVPVVLLALGIWYEVAVWNECLVDHPWWYCLRVIGR